MSKRLNHSYNQIPTVKSYVTVARSKKPLLARLGAKPIDNKIVKLKEFNPPKTFILKTNAEEAATAKASETPIVNRLKVENGHRMNEDQHGFTTGKSTIIAMEDVLAWTDDCPNRCHWYFPGHLRCVRQPIVGGVIGGYG